MYFLLKVVFIVRKNTGNHMHVKTTSDYAIRRLMQIELGVTHHNICRMKSIQINLYQPNWRWSPAELIPSFPKKIRQMNKNCVTMDSHCFDSAPTPNPQPPTLSPTPPHTSICTSFWPWCVTSAKNFKLILTWRMFFSLISGYYVHITTFQFWCKWKAHLFLRSNSKDYSFILTHPVAMKASPTCYGLRLVDLFVMCCAILVHLSATNETQSE